MKPKKRKVRSRLSDLSRIGYQHGVRAGYNKGYDQGFHDGWEVGVQQSRITFEGTSIIIPTFNQLKYVKECIESIQKYTHHPYEIIVVDNGSDDGTQPYLRSLSAPIHCCIMPNNIGFAGAVNQGLRLAKGKTIVILNNDAVVTQQWLSNLLECVNSDPSVGIAGPVTNYISGDQLIEVNYQNMEEMQRFARQHNVSDRHRWVDTERLTGFCMVMRRDVFERLGYFDEGFEIGNCEDDDYGLRTRLLGLRLVICKDTFIHHYGSVSMKNLHSEFDSVYQNNLAYYSNKWEDPNIVLRILKTLSQSTPHRMIDYYPTHVTVKGNQQGVFWIENGMRYFIDSLSQDPTHAIRLSDIDLNQWAIGGNISEHEYRQKCSVLGSETHLPVADGMIVKSPEGPLYQLKGTTRHRIISDHTWNTWFQHRQWIKPVDKEFIKNYDEGLPIISPIVMKASNL